MKVKIILLLLVLFVSKAFSQNKDTLKTYNLKEVKVLGKKYFIDQTLFPVEKDNLSDILELGGFSIIRKGGFLAQDVYADGLKRGDYTIVVDGERYHNACPMRMDAPITRINPVDVKSINLVKSSSNLQAGLGGIIEVNRSVPRDKLGFSGNLSRSFGKSDETDFSMFLEKSKQRVSLRYVEGRPYKTADNLSFKDLYGYKENTKFQFGEASINGVHGDLKYSGSLMYTENVSFPYLKMDEKKSVVYNSSISYKNYKIYFNYTDHLMNNSLRVSNMDMETDARNLTLGFVTGFAEIYYRHWDADNEINMMNGKMKIENHILPAINLYSANFFKTIEFDGYRLSGKIGLSYYNLGDKEKLEFYDPVHAGAKDYRVFPLMGLSFSKTGTIFNKASITGMIDVATEAPEAEALYVNVKRMKGKPYWSGNPNLDQPLRTTVRANLNISSISLDMYGSYIANYVYLASAKNGEQKYQTFGNVNALILGLNLNVNYKYFDSKISYTYGENRTNDKPLIEILPLHISNSIYSPEILGTKIFIKHTYENAQKRIDESFDEIKSSAWNKVDLGIIYKIDNFTIGFDAENIFNHNFSKYLSYVRDPFASGMKVIEPGVSYKLNLRYTY